MIMGEEWIKECNSLLGQLRESLKAENPDRLELVRSMHLALIAINHSTLGWLQYVNNPDVTSMFNLDEIKEIHGALKEIAETYILHDIEVTEKGIQKGLSLIKHDEDPQPFYV